MKTRISLVITACVLLQCALGGFVTLPVNQLPSWNLCANGGDIFSCSGHGMCSGVNGQCVCTDGYTGVDCSVPPGGFPYPIPGPASVTQFCQLETGGCAPGMCVGGGSFDNTNLPPGVDGVAAVNPTIYGGRYNYVSSPGAGYSRTVNGQYSFVGPACGTCWKLTRASVSIVVAIVDRCAGYCRATLQPNQTCTASNIQGAKECGECINVNEPSIPQCSCLSPAATNNKGWCNGYTTAHCDWCAANDHPHFDLDITSQVKICAEAAGDGFCHLDSFQMVACPDFIGPWPNGYPNGTGAPPTTKPVTSGGGGGGSTADVCSYTTGNGVCNTISGGSYACNGCNLTMCHLGSLWNLGCPRGTSCQAGVCQIGVPCDPQVTSCTPTSSSTTAPTTPTTAPTTAPTTPTTAPTAKPTTAPTTPPATQPPTKAATQPPATQPPATQPPTKAATQPPATTAPTTAPITTQPTAAACKREVLTPEEEEEENIIAQARAVEKYRIDRQEAIAKAIEQQKQEL